MPTLIARFLFYCYLNYIFYQIGTVGISDHASHELGDIVYIEIPEVGQQIQKGDSVGSIESVKIAASMGSPASGTVTKVNYNINSPYFYIIR